LSAIILAGGDGSRLSGLTKKIAGEEIPKQFCPILTDETLLEQTLKRVLLVVPSSRTVTVLTRQHERFYQALTFNCGDAARSSSAKLIVNQRCTKLCSVDSRLPSGKLGRCKAPQGGSIRRG